MKTGNKFFLFVLFAFAMECFTGKDQKSDVRSATYCLKNELMPLNPRITKYCDIFVLVLEMLKLSSNHFEK